MPIKFGELLLKENMITPQQLQAALDHQKSKGGGLQEAVVSLGFVKEEEIVRLVSRPYSVPFLDLHAVEVDPQVIKVISAATARNYRVLPLSVNGNLLRLAMVDPTNVFAMDDMKFMTGYNVEPVAVSKVALEAAFHRYYGSSPPLETPETARTGGEHGLPSDGGSAKDTAEGHSDGTIPPAKMLVNLILVDSIIWGASEIQVTMGRDAGLVSYRLRGRVRQAGRFPIVLYDRLVNVVRLMSSRLWRSDRREFQEAEVVVAVRGALDLAGREAEREFLFRVELPLGDKSCGIRFRRIEDAFPSQLGREILESPLFQKTGSFRLRRVASGPTRG